MRCLSVGGSERVPPATHHAVALAAVRRETWQSGGIRTGAEGIINFRLLRTGEQLTSHGRFSSRCIAAESGGVCRVVGRVDMFVLPGAVVRADVCTVASSGRLPVVNVLAAHGFAG